MIFKNLQPTLNAYGEFIDFNIKIEVLEININNNTNTTIDKTKSTTKTTLQLSIHGHPFKSLMKKEETHHTLEITVSGGDKLILYFEPHYFSADRVAGIKQNIEEIFMGVINGVTEPTTREIMFTLTTPTSGRSPGVILGKAIEKIDIKTFIVDTFNLPKPFEIVAKVKSD